MRWMLTLILTLLLMGAASAELIAIPTAIDFGQVPVGNSDTQFLVLINNGDEAVQVNVWVSGDVFSMERPINHILMPHDTVFGIGVTFAPQAAQLYEGAVEVTVDDPTNPVLTVPLTGEGIEGGPPPLWFELIAPEYNANFPSLPITFSWEAVDAPGDPVVNYTLWILGGDPIREPVAYAAGTATSYVLDNDPRYTDGSRHMWWVTAEWDGGVASSSEMRLFNIGEVPPLPGSFSLLAPEDGATITTETCTFSWERLDNPEVEAVYEISIIPSARDDEILTLMVGYDTSATIDLSGLTNNQGCTWYVMAYTNAGEAVQSDEMWQFQLARQGNPPTDTDDPRVSPVAERFGIASLAPNPFNPETRIAISVPLAGRVQAEVFDILGRKVATLVNAPLAAGEHRFTWRPDGPAGMYLLRVSHAGGGTDVRRLMFIK